MKVNIIDNSGMRSFDGPMRLVFDDGSVVDTSVDELRAKLNTGLTQEKVELRAQFIEFYNKYGKYQKKADAFRVWCKLKPTEREAIMANVELFVLANPDITFRPMPVTYLRGRRWEDELPAGLKKKEDNNWAPRNSWKNDE